MSLHENFGRNGEALPDMTLGAVLQHKQQRNKHGAIVQHTPPVDFAAIRLAATEDDFGFTVSIAGDRKQQGDDGYVVSLRGYETCYLNRPTTQELRDYILRYIEVLEEPDLYVGGWFDKETGEFVLDVSIVLHTLDRAMGYARQAGQKAIYDLKTGECLTV